MTRIHRYTVLLSFLGLAACSEPIDNAPTPVGPVVFAVGGERPPVTNADSANEEAANDGAPIRAETESDGVHAPNLINPAPRQFEGNGRWPDPPTATLRAPADPRIDEVDSQTGLPPLPR